jgi:RimJ/RimL family protein N-acetyltransferase
MLHELEPSQFALTLPLFDPYLQDPLLHTVLEGRRKGRVFVDDPGNPRTCFVWTNSECAYLLGKEGKERLNSALHQLLVEEIIPATKAAGRDYLSLFPFPNSIAPDLERALRDLLPLQTPVSTYSFNPESFSTRRAKSDALPSGFRLKTIDAEILQDPGNANLAEEIAFYWGSIDDFPQGLGHCVLHGDNVVSWCYVQAVGAESQTIDVWTAPEHRRKGLGTAVASAFIARCLSVGHKPFWLNDEANVDSRRLAERLGFEYQGDIRLVDIPFHPFDFYRGLAMHFFLPNQAYHEAAEALERAFTVREGEAEDYYNAAVAWASAGSVDMAWDNLLKAVDHGWQDVESAENEKALAPLRGTDEWKEAMIVSLKKDPDAFTVRQYRPPPPRTDCRGRSGGRRQRTPGHSLSGGWFRSAQEGNYALSRIRRKR